MAQVYGNPNAGYGSNGGTDFNANKFILKDEYKRNWFIYRSAGGSFVKPYPVFDSNGTPCPTRNDNTDALDHTLLSDAFAVLGTVSFAGVNGDLELIDYCSDTERYLPPGQDYIRTPFTTLITTLRKMLPAQNGPKDVAIDKYPIPRQLLQMQKNVSYPVSTIMFRGALCRHKGNPMTTKASVEGILFNTVFCITQKSATNSFYAQLNQARDFNSPPSANNNMFDSMFNIRGVGIQFNKGIGGGGQGSTADSYQVSAFKDQAYEATACRKFGCAPEGYYNSLREFFGPAQRIGDMLHIMTVEEMVNVIKNNYPISWIWYSFKDTPYADLITQEERMKAQADPEMAQRFGLVGSAPAQDTAPKSYGTYQPPTTSYQPNYGQPATPPPPPPRPATQAYAPPTEPSWASAGYNPPEDSFRDVPSNSIEAGYPEPSVGNTPPMPSDVHSDATAAFLNKYGVTQSVGSDGIKY